MTEAKRRKLSLLKVLVIIVAVIVVVLFVTAGIQINNYAKGGRYTPDAREYIYSVENGRFGNLYDSAVRDMDKHASYGTEVQECRALAFYYEQAVLEHAYRMDGNDTKADEFAARMEEYEEQLGSLSSKANVVKERLADFQ